MLCACSCVALQQLTAVLQMPVWQTGCHGPRLFLGVLNTHTWMATHQVCVMLIALSRPNVPTETEFTHSTLIQSGVTQVEYLRGMASIQRDWLTDDAIRLIMLAICQTAFYGMQKCVWVCRVYEHRTRVSF